MPLNRPALSLVSGPRGVQDARQRVVDTCREIGRPDLVECAQLGVSELVTNALLHATAPVRVCVRGTVKHPRVEVHDGSRVRPVLPSPDSGDDELLLTFGRGLAIVARCADAWGAQIEADGKTVWFAPAVAFAEGAGARGVVLGDEEPTRSAPQDPVSVVLLDVPISHYLGFQRHFRELRREVRLLALAHEHAYPLAKELSDLFTEVERLLREGVGLEALDDAAERGAAYTQVDLLVSRRSTQVMERFIELLDLADDFCRQQRLLSLARTEEQRRFQRWYLGQFVRQGRDEPPVAWQGAPTRGRRRSVS